VSYNFGLIFCSPYYIIVDKENEILKRTTEEVAKYFEEQGCKLLGEYTGAMVPMEYICICGRTSKM
jgi:hypothetical protein